MHKLTILNSTVKLRSMRDRKIRGRQSCTMIDRNMSQVRLLRHCLTHLARPTCKHKSRLKRRMPNEPKLHLEASPFLDATSNSSKEIWSNIAKIGESSLACLDSLAKHSRISKMYRMETKLMKMKRVRTMKAQTTGPY